MKKTITAVAVTALTVMSLSLGLIGCRTAAERQEAEAKWRAKEAAEQEAKQQAYIKVLASNCIAYGFQPATPAFAQCLQNENIAVQQKEGLEIQKKAIRDAKWQQAKKRMCSLGGDPTAPVCF